MSNADVLVSTPEKWDLITRGWNGLGRRGELQSKPMEKVIKDVHLLIIDEIHLLGEERGAILEAIVSRTQYISRYVKRDKERICKEITFEDTFSTRILGLSTAIANPYDLADWIGIKANKQQYPGPNTAHRMGLYNFRANVRPVRLDVHVSGFAGRHYCPRMSTMNKPCYV